MNVASNDCGLKWLWSQMTVISNDCDLKWTWSQMTVVSNEYRLKWMWSQIAVVSSECGLKWTWSQMNRFHMNMVSNEQVSNVVVSNERGLRWIGLNCQHTEWNTWSCSSREDKGTILFQVCCSRVNIFPINFNFTYTRQVMSEFGINVIHVMNFSNVQDVLCISVMHVMSKVRIFVPAKHTLQAILYQTHCKILGIPPLFFSFLDFSWLRRFYPIGFMPKPSRNHVSVIKCSQIRKKLAKRQHYWL